MTLSVVVAAYNEERTIAQVVRDLRSLPHRPAIIVVDDGSTDGTLDSVRTAAGPDLTVVALGRNGGKGAAIRAGIAESGGDVIALHDADLELSVAPITEMVRIIEEGRADAVFGHRFGPGHGSGRTCRLGNAWLTAAANRLYAADLSDISCGQKVFDGLLLRSLPLRADGFEFEAEVTALALRSGARILEVPVPYRPRSRTEGKKVRYLRDGIRSLMTLLRLRRRDRGSVVEEERVHP